MSKKKRNPNPTGRVNENPNPNPDNSADKQEVKGRLKEKAKSAGSKVVGVAKGIGKKVWDNRGKIGIIAGAATVALVKFGASRGSDISDDDYDDDCPDEIEQVEPDEETFDTEAADE